jgi:hypothetical protein
MENRELIVRTFLGVASFSQYSFYVFKKTAELVPIENAMSNKSVYEAGSYFLDLALFLYNLLPRIFDISISEKISGHITRPVFDRAPFFPKDR